MTAPDEGFAYRVTLKDVDKKVDDFRDETVRELSALRNMISDRIPQGVDERLRKVEAQIAAQWVVVGIVIVALGALLAKSFTA